MQPNSSDVLLLRSFCSAVFEFQMCYIGLSSEMITITVMCKSKYRNLLILFQIVKVPLKL